MHGCAEYGSYMANYDGSCFCEYKHEGEGCDNYDPDSEYEMWIAYNVPAAGPPTDATGAPVGPPPEMV